MIFDSKDFIKNVQSLGDFIQRSSEGELDINAFRASIKTTDVYWTEHGESGGFHSDEFLKNIFGNSSNNLSNLKMDSLFELFNYSIDWSVCLQELDANWINTHHEWQTLLRDYEITPENISDFNQLPIYSKKDYKNIDLIDRRLMQSVEITEEKNLKKLKGII